MLHVSERKRLYAFLARIFSYPDRELTAALQEGEAAEVGSLLLTTPAPPTTLSSTVELVPSELGPVLRIRSVTTDPEPYYLRAHALIELPQAIGLRVRRMRQASGRSQLELALAAGIAANYLSDVERGQQTPTIATLAHIASALDADLSTIVDLRAEASEEDLRDAIRMRLKHMPHDQLLLVLRFVEAVRF